MGLCVICECVDAPDAPAFMLREERGVHAFGVASLTLHHVRTRGIDKTLEGMCPAHRKAHDRACEALQPILDEMLRDQADSVS